MKNVIFPVILVLLYGCGGEAFTSGSTEAAGAAGTPDDGAVSATGGAAGSTGGASSSGGHATGGASTGGVAIATGGSDATGGTTSTGGAPMATGGAPEVDAGCTLVTHDNGLGATWQDCVPLGTYNEEQAMKACKASAAKCAKIVTCGPSLPEVRGLSADDTLIVGRWGYAGALAGFVGTGGSGELCLGANDPNNVTWL